MVRSHSGALDMGDNHAEGSCDPELEVLNSEIVGPEVRTVGIEKLGLVFSLPRDHSRRENLG
jgi:hypothetical protein